MNKQTQTYSDNLNGNIVIPPFFCPITSAVHKEVEAVDAFVKQWIQDFELVEPGGKQFLHVSKSKFGWCGANSFPDVSREDAEMVSCLIAWYFLYDDTHVDTIDATSADHLMKIQNRYMEILRGDEVTAQDEPLALALHDIYCRLQRRTDELWINSFADNMETYLRANIWEVFNRRDNRVPDLAIYTKMRQFTSAVYAVCDMIAITRDINPRSKFISDLYSRQLRTMTNNITSWDNDIIGFHKELLEEENMNNLVIVLQNQHKISLQEAIYQAVEIRNSEMKAFFELESQFLEFGFGPTEDAELRRYVKGLRSWIRGMLDFYVTSARYQLPSEISYQG